jgi:hypothetical protein
LPPEQEVVRQAQVPVAFGAALPLPQILVEDLGAGCRDTPQVAAAIGTLRAARAVRGGAHDVLLVRRRAAVTTVV